MEFGLDLLAVEGGKLHGALGILDYVILAAYLVGLIGLGFYTSRKIVSSEEFMVAGRKIPGWAAGLSVMCAYTSSISYIATPGKSFDSNFNPVIFAYAMLPVALFVSSFIVAYYRSIGLISVYEFLERRLGYWGRVYAAISFMLYMIGRVAVILYLVCLLLDQFVTLLPDDPYKSNLLLLISVIGVITIIYTLLGGMEAVIWADVMQSIIMLSGIAICGGILTWDIVASGTIVEAWNADKFSLGSWSASLNTQEDLADRTIWVMVIYGLTENLRNLMADQNYVQKYAACSSEKEAKRSIWVATIIYVLMTTIFVYIGTALWAHYYGTDTLQKAGITKGDEVFPFYIAEELITGFKGLLIAAILAAAISTIATAFNCSATIWLQDFHKKFINKNITDRQSIFLLRIVTVVWGLLGIGFAFWMIKARSALDVWWTMSGIFGGGILGLFLLALLKVRLRLWQGIVAIVASILTISWGTFIRQGLIDKLLASETWEWLGNTLRPIQCDLDPIIIGATGTAVMMVVAIILSLFNRGEAIPGAESA